MNYEIYSRNWIALLSAWAGRYFISDFWSSLKPLCRPGFWSKTVENFPLCATVAVVAGVAVRGLVHLGNLPLWAVNSAPDIFALGSSMLTAHILGKGKSSLSPAIQRALNLLIPSDRYEEFFGDLAEGYNARYTRLGKAAADRWYYRQLLASVGPFLLAAARRTATMVVRS